MRYHAKNAVVKLPDAEMEYIRFGTGKRILVMLPGLGDSLRSMKGTALPMALLYRMFAKDFTVYAFSRRRDMPQGYTTRDMAKDQILAMEILGIKKADIFGVSMGGMIAQYIAIDYPEKVNKLVLAVTSSQPNPVLLDSLREWISCAERGDHTAFMRSNLRRIYSDAYCRRNGWMVPLIGKLTKPGSYACFFIQAEACRSHNAYDLLSTIQAPTFIIGGQQDKTLGAEASKKIAEKIPNAKLHMYPQWGHGLYEEAKDFNERIFAYLTR